MMIVLLLVLLLLLLLMMMMLVVMPTAISMTTTTMIPLICHLQMSMSAPLGSTDATRSATTPTAATRAHVRWATGLGRITRRVKVLSH